MANLQSQNALTYNRPRSFAHPTSKISPIATISGARFGQPFEASRDIHIIAKNVHCHRRCCHPGGCRQERDAALGRDRCVLLGSALLDRDRAAHRGNDASKLDQEAVAGYSLSGRVLFGLRVDDFAEEGLETFATATDRAASVAPLHALSSAQ